LRQPRRGGARAKGPAKAEGLALRAGEVLQAKGEITKEEIYFNLKISKLQAGVPIISCAFSMLNNKKKSAKNHTFIDIESKLNPNYQKFYRSKCLLGNFLVCGDQISLTETSLNPCPPLSPFRSNGGDEETSSGLRTSQRPKGQKNICSMCSVKNSGQIIHYNIDKITLRRGQAIFISPKAILHKFDNDFINAKTPVITLSYQRLKTGDIIQGIPKVEQFFEARGTKRGRIFRDSLPALLKGLFYRYKSKYPLELAVRQSFYKIQQIIVDGVQRVYKAQGVTIADKHLEVVVKQMTSKVKIMDGAQTGFFP
jgi:DNA-directed RNA polymerase subunit beta'